MKKGMASAIVIDDDRDITEVFSELLNLQGIDVLDSGHDGEDAVMLVEKHRPDMVFLDVHMPRRGWNPSIKRNQKEINTNKDCYDYRGFIKGLGKTIARVRDCSYHIQAIQYGKNHASLARC